MNALIHIFIVIFSSICGWISGKLKQPIGFIFGFMTGVLLTIYYAGLYK